VSGLVVGVVEWKKAQNLYGILDLVSLSQRLELHSLIHPFPLVLPIFVNICASLT
jgi:hypothetical protein